MYRVLTFVVLGFAILLRLLLCWANPSGNYFDNHYLPISLILETGAIPAKDACFQCYNPPVFYVVSAVVAKGLMKAGLALPAVVKGLQFLNCFYACLTLPVLYLILRKMKLSELSTLVAFSIVCFLPRSIYMAAIHSNDCLTYLMVALCTYLLLLCIEDNFPLSCLVLLSGALSASVFVKYTAYVVLPMTAVPLLFYLIKSERRERSRALAALVLLLLPVCLLIGAYLKNNFHEYGQVLPWNDKMIDTAKVQPRDPGGADFTSFTPWKYCSRPIILPGQMQSFWTLAYSGAWIDNEPKFTYFTDKHPSWWNEYYSWLRGDAEFPGTAVPISSFTRLLAAGLLTCGLVPLALGITGFGICLRSALSRRGTPLPEAVKLLVFPTLLLFNVAGIVLLALKAPVYSSMKASYFLNSLPAFCVLLAAGVQSSERISWLSKTIVCSTWLLVALSSFNTLYIVWSIISG